VKGQQLSAGRLFWLDDRGTSAAFAGRPQLHFSFFIV
jgi:hypothetical protein